jgi:hypothetical protein
LTGDLRLGKEHLRMSDHKALALDEVRTVHHDERNAGGPEAEANT